MKVPDYPCLGQLESRFVLAISFSCIRPATLHLRGIRMALIPALIPLSFWGDLVGPAGGLKDMGHREST